ncbi:helix-turn-helix transcriptional regulator [Halomonas sp. M4R1S46]|uniref:helix-turn-helix transcriptional regulator n=1 Tax=Halomonas sp. M4R1S46 TaxID=2982692 RepID=UPI0021E3CE6F|nr:AlpA family phage regulatory protein [Halomonas sp. M4R1S46]UYG08397.1 AlpA family phage regulatory protein [Halomonas sp. M4R1S46]
MKEAGNTTTEQPPLRFLKVRDVCDKIAVSRSRLYELLIEDEDFPKPFKDSDSRQAPNYWVEHEIEEWMRRRMERARRR